MSCKSRKRKAVLRRIRRDWRERRAKLPPAVIADTVLAQLRHNMNEAFKRAYADVPMFFAPEYRHTSAGFVKA